MDSNLILYDIDCFLDKYTRFMTKDIYISNGIYQRFLEQYQYLYQNLEKEYFLYGDNPKYKKMMDIKRKKIQLVKLHNQKYLQGTIKRNQDFFEEVFPGESISTRIKSIIFSEEEKLLVVQDKGFEKLIVGKINFLLKKYNYSCNQILILTSDIEQKRFLLNVMRSRNIDVEVRTVKEYGLSFLKEEEYFLDNDKKYTLFSQYFINKLFSQKEKFEEFYRAFSKYIYLNKDYKDFETFNDYHNYMYKRKFLSSGLFLKKFNEQEIKKRRTYLRTIKNEIMNTKEEVDIANFLYLNSISYHYQQETSIFSIWLDEKKDQVQYCIKRDPLEIQENLGGECIYLYAYYNENKNALQVLAYELIKRRYPLQLVSEDALFRQLRHTTIENYFSEFIRNYLIPTVDYYEKYNSLDNTRLNSKQKEVIKDLYLEYKKEVTRCHYVREQELLSRIKKDIGVRDYRYLFLVGDVSFKVKIPTFAIVSDYQEVQLLKESIKLLYDYKKYLYQNQQLPIAHVYLDYQELNSLTSSFLKDNLIIINKALQENKKEIDIQEYDDKNRLHVYQNISCCCNDILKNNINSNVLVAFTKLKDMKLLISSGLFSKCDKNTLFTRDKQKVFCEEILNISKLYDIIVVPYLIMDSYHDDFLRDDYDYYIKVMLYVALSRCRKKLVLLCPKSKSQELEIILKKIGRK